MEGRSLDEYPIGKVMSVASMCIVICGYVIARAARNVSELPATLGSNLFAWPALLRVM